MLGESLKDAIRSRLREAMPTRDIFAKALARDCMHYCASPAFAATLLRDWHDLCRGVCRAVVVVEGPEQKARALRECVGAEVLLFSEIECCAGVTALLFYAVEDAFLLEATVSKARSFLRDIPFKMALTVSPIAFRDYLSKVGAGHFECHALREIEPFFYKKVLAGARMQYYTERDAGNRLSREKLAALESVVRDMADAYIYIERREEIRPLEEIIKGWPSRIGGHDTASLVDNHTSTRSNQNAGIGSQIPPKVTVSNKIPPINNLPTNLILFDFIPVLLNCNLYVLAPATKEEYFQELLDAENYIESEVRPPAAAGEEKGAGSETYTFKVLSDATEEIRQSCQKRAFIRRVSGHGRHTSVLAFCKVGRIQTAVNIYGIIGYPVIMPWLKRLAGSACINSVAHRLELGTLTSYRSFADALLVHGQCYISLGSRSIVIYNFSVKLNLRIEVRRENIEACVLLSTHLNRKDDSPERSFVGELYIPLCSYPQICIHENSSHLARKIKDSSSAEEKVSYFEAMEWRRASIRDVPFFEGRYDLHVSVPLDDDAALADTAQLGRVIPMLQRMCSSVVYTSVHKEPVARSLSEVVDHFSGWDFDAFFSVLSLVSRKGRFLVNRLSREDLRIMDGLDIPAFCKALDARLKDRFIPVRISDLYHSFDPANNTHNSIDSSHAAGTGSRCLVRTAMLTPMGPVFHCDANAETNRVLRHFDQDKFIRVTIRNDDGGKFLNDSEMNQDGVYDYFRRIMLEGLIVGPRRYFFLAATTSQLKQHSAWFITPHDSNGVLIGADYVKSWLGDFTTIKNIGKYTVRIGQALSSTTDTFEVHDFLEVPDIERNGHCFTDGIGMISPCYAARVAQALGMATVPSAFQVRFAGYKGVVAVQPLLENPRLFEQWRARNLDATDQNGRMAEEEPGDKAAAQLVFRASMNKFYSKHRMLEIVTTAKSTDFFLNRQIILILEGLGVPSRVFIHLQDNYVLSVLESLFSDLPGFIRKYVSAFPKNFISTDYRFFRKLLGPVLSGVFEDLAKKSKILVPQGRAAMGVTDELQVLDENEVFLMYANSGADMPGTVRYGVFSVPVGTAIIAKCPCMHPGDVRVVRCVDRQDLHYMKDVLVFSQRGARPLFNQCSGSDLDGDIFLLSWSQALVPRVVYKPYNYTNTTALSKERVLLSDMVNFYIRYIKSYQLGIIANSFMAAADKHTVFGSKVLRLAELFNRNIDFIKTGSIASLPEDLIPGSFPDYMERTPAYVSERALGQLYRRSGLVVRGGCECRHCIERLMLDEFEEWQVFLLRGATIRLREETIKAGPGSNGRMGTGNTGCLKRSARDLFFEYRFELKALIAKYDLHNEEALFFSRSPACQAELKEVLARYVSILEGADTQAIAELSMKCSESINSMVWLTDQAYRVRSKGFVYKESRAVGNNFIFNTKIILEDRKGSAEDKRPMPSGTAYERSTDAVAGNAAEHNARSSIETNRILEDENFIHISDMKAKNINDNGNEASAKSNSQRNPAESAISFHRNYKNNAITAKADMRKYQRFVELLDPARTEIFKEAFNLILLSGLYAVDQIDEIVDLMFLINQKMGSSTKLEFARAAFSLADNVLFRIGFLLSLDSSIVYKALMLREPRAEHQTSARPCKTRKSTLLIINGMMDENDDVEFAKRNGMYSSISKSMYMPLLKNRGFCSTDYYRDNVRDFVAGILFSGENAQFADAGRGRAHATAGWALMFTPGTFYLSRLHMSLVHDRISIRELEALIAKNDPAINTWFINSHCCLDPAERAACLRHARPMRRMGEQHVLSFGCKDVRYDLEYADGMLVRVLRGRRVLGRAYMVNSDAAGMEMGASGTDNRKSNDLMIELVRFEIVYTELFNYLSEEEGFLLSPCLYMLEDAQCRLSSQLSHCTTPRLEISTSFMNADHFCMSHKVVFTGSGTNLQAGDGKLCVYATREWTARDEFDRMFGKLWKVYSAILL